MTLNITILTPKVIYQSADYMLFDPTAGRPLEMPSTKVVVLNYFDWTGFVTYTGIGKVGPKHTSQFVQDWVSKLDQPSFDQVVETIRSNATSWVARVKPGERHTFVVAAFVEEAPTAAVVSNFERWHGAKSGVVETEFVDSRVASRRRVEILVTGQSIAVPRPRQRGLRRLAQEASNDAARIRRAMASANRDGAARFPDKISEDCFVYSQDKDGQGHYETMGITRTDLLVATGAPGLDSTVRKLLDQEFGHRKWSLRGMTSVTSKTSSGPPVSCELGPSIEPGASGYRAVVLAHPEGQRATPRAINSHGTIVGEACAAWRGPSYPCAWPKHEEIRFLTHGGGLGGRACGINESGVIVGSSESPDRAAHACTWTLDGHCEDIGGAIARHSQATAVNDAGNIVGWVSIHPTEGGQAHFRPAYWPNMGTPVVLDDLDGGWGEAVDVNSNDVVLLRVHAGRGMGLSGQVEAWTWSNGTTVVAGRPDGNTKDFYPKRVLNDGCIVGLAIQRNGDRYAAVRRLDGSWSRLFDPRPGRELTAASATHLAGYETVDDYRVPWFMPIGGEITYLPHYRFHHHQVTMVSADGRMVGTASADNCCHPIVWIPQGLGR